tara:strand:+ start:383 stop:1084 length:702 start_codon:yes stop_codon:yes gene_type:complete
MIDNDKKKIENNYLLNNMYKFVLFIENEIIEISKKKNIELFYFIKKINRFFETIKINYILANILYIIYLFYSLVNKDYIFIIYSILIYIILYLIFKKNAVIYIYIFIIANLFFELFFKKSDRGKNIIENLSLMSNKNSFSKNKKNKDELSEEEKKEILSPSKSKKPSEEKSKKYDTGKHIGDKKNTQKYIEKELDNNGNDDKAKQFGEDKDKAEKEISNNYNNSALSKKKRLF